MSSKSKHTGNRSEKWTVTEMSNEKSILSYWDGERGALFQGSGKRALYRITSVVDKSIKDSQCTLFMLVSSFIFIHQNEIVQGSTSLVLIA